VDVLEPIEYRFMPKKQDNNDQMTYEPLPPGNIQQVVILRTMEELAMLIISHGANPKLPVIA
jgi:hypothetical protein